MRTDWWATVLSGIVGNVIAAVVSALVAVYVVRATQRHDRAFFADQAAEAERQVRRRIAIEAADRLVAAVVVAIDEVRDALNKVGCYDLISARTADSEQPRPHMPVCWVRTIWLPGSMTFPPASTSSPSGSTPGPVGSLGLRAMTRIPRRRGHSGSGSGNWRVRPAASGSLDLIPGRQAMDASPATGPAGVAGRSRQSLVPLSRQRAPGPSPGRSPRTQRASRRQRVTAVTTPRRR